MASHEAIVHGFDRDRRDLKIVHDDHLLNLHVDIGVIDELGQTEWVRVSRDELVTALRDLGVI